jgi:hypothetical protein
VSLLCSEEMMDFMELFFPFSMQYMHVNYDHDSVTLLPSRLEKSVGS